MQFSAAKNFAIYALPIMAAFAPAFANASCPDDAMGFTRALENIEIDYDSLTPDELTELRGMNGYYAGMPHRKEAAVQAAKNVVDEVVAQFLGEDFIGTDIPAYPAFDYARDAFICVMSDIRNNNRILMEDDRNKLNAFEDAFYSLMFETAITEDDIRVRIQTLEELGAQGLFGTPSHNDGYAGPYFDEVTRNISDLAHEPHRVQGYVDFAIAELQSEDTLFNRDTLAEILGKVVAHTPDRIPEYLEIIASDEDAFKESFSGFFNNLESRDFDDSIFAILESHVESENGQIARYAFFNMTRLADVNPEYLDIAYNSFYQFASDPELAAGRNADYIGIFARSNTRFALRDNDEALKHFYLDYWDNVLSSDGGNAMRPDRKNDLLIMLDNSYQNQSNEIQARISELAGALKQFGANYETRFIAGVQPASQSLTLD